MQAITAGVGYALRSNELAGRAYLAWSTTPPSARP